jgi:hypothetical protein
MDSIVHEQRTEIISSVSGAFDEYGIKFVLATETEKSGLMMPSLLNLYATIDDTLTKDELEEWKMKLMKEVDEKDKHFFTKENISSKARNIGAKMKDYSEEELCLVTLMVYTDYCKTIKKFMGANMDIYVELARDWLEDEDSELKGSERLAVYHDCIIEGED